MSTKQVIVINRGTDPKMRRGKEIAQGGHASGEWWRLRLAGLAQASDGHWLRAVRISPAEKEWLESGCRKVVLQAASAEELQHLCLRARLSGLEAHLITDSGATEFGGKPTITALAIGPDYDEKIDPITSHLTLY